MSATRGATGPTPAWVEECLARKRAGLHVLMTATRTSIYSIPLRYGVPHQDAADIFQRFVWICFNELPRLRDAKPCRPG